jgi:hypothetical protein
MSSLDISIVAASSAEADGIAFCFKDSIDAICFI